MTELAKRRSEGEASARASTPEENALRDAGDTAAQARLELMLVSGGDERIWPDPVSRRNRYGTPGLPAPDELWFSSSTASAITARGHAAAKVALDSLAPFDGGRGRDPAGWFDALRGRICDLLGVPGTEAILSASGTEAELMTLALAKTLLRRPVANIIVAPDETGSGVIHAAAGTHFAATAAFEPHVEKGAPLAGWNRDGVETMRVDIRDAAGRPRDAAAIDRDACASVERALLAGQDALLHVLDTSKTGRGGPSRALAREIARSAGDRALVVVDACQLRCSFDQIKADLESGFLVMVTGSKFAGGPPFCGALLVPPGFAGRLRELRLPNCLAAYSARLDWPLTLSAALNDRPFALANLGMGLRWEAALGEIEAYAKIPARRRADIAAAFAQAVRRGVAANESLDFLDDTLWRLNGEPATIFPILTHEGDERQARLIYEAMRAPGRGPADLSAPELSRPCHLGQPVVIGKRAALRMCFSMPQANFVAARLCEGMTLDAAFRPVREDIELTFRKWAALAKRFAATGAAPASSPNIVRP